MIALSLHLGALAWMPSPVKQAALPLSEVKPIRVEIAALKPVSPPVAEKSRVTPLPLAAVEKKAKALLPRPGKKQVVHKKRLQKRKPLKKKIKAGQKKKPDPAPEKKVVKPQKEEMAAIDPEPQHTLPAPVKKDWTLTAVSSDTQAVLPARSGPDPPVKVSSATTATEIVMARPLYKKNRAPEYPSKAKRRGYEGIVELNAMICEDGRVCDLKLFKSSGFSGLDDQAMKCVRNWTFAPGTVNGRPEAMWVRIPIKFALK